MIDGPVQVSVFSESGGQPAPSGPTVSRMSPLVTSIFSIRPASNEKRSPAWREELVDVLVQASDGGRVNYSVPGHPLLGDVTVQHLLSEDRSGRIELELLDNPLPVALTEILALSDGYPTFVDVVALLDIASTQPFSAGIWPASTSQSVVVTNVLLSDHGEFLSKFLDRRYRPETLVRLAPMTGRPLQIEVPLSRLAQHADMPPSYVVLSPVVADHYQKSADDLQRIVARLRAPGGCPWDREQTHQTLMRNLIEESYELLDAIEREDVGAMREEMGDFLLQALLHCQIAEEMGTFTFEDVVGSLIEKLVRRHPHVFGSVVAGNPDEVIQTWDSIKQAERAASEKKPASSPLGEIPESIPALMRAQTVLKRALRSGINLDMVEGHVENAYLELESDDDRRSLEELVRLVRRSLEADVDLELQVRQWTRAFETSISRSSDPARTRE